MGTRARAGWKRENVHLMILMWNIRKGGGLGDPQNISAPLRGFQFPSLLPVHKNRCR